MGMPKKITAQTVRYIELFLDEGLSAPQIADQIGCTLGTLRVRCSQLGISLRKRNRDKAARGHGTRRKHPSERPSARRRGHSKAAAGNGFAKDGSDDRAPLVLLLSRVTVGQLQREARMKGISDALLAARLLEVIARDRLYEAVLDEHEVYDGQSAPSVT